MLWPALSCCISSVLHGCALADLAELTQELLDGSDLIEVMQSLCPSHFMRDETLVFRLATALKNDPYSSCESVVTGVLHERMQAAGGPSVHRSAGSGNNSVHLDLNMTMETANLFIHGAAVRLCEDKHQWTNMAWSDISVEELQEGIGPSIRESVSAGLGAVLPKQDEDYRHIALVCSAGTTARAALCMDVDEDTENWIDDESIALEEENPRNDTAAVFASVIAKSIDGNCGGMLGYAGDHIVLKVDWNLTGGSTAGWSVAFEEDMMRRIMLASQVDLCRRLRPWVEQYRDLLLRNASNGKYMEVLREMVLEQRRDRLQEMFECEKADALDDLSDKELSRRVAKFMKDVFHPKKPQSWVYQRRWVVWIIMVLFTLSLCTIAFFGPRFTAREVPLGEPGQSLVE